MLIACSALFSGLTLGLMGLDVHELKRKMDLGNLDAARVYPVRKRGNLLLTTLLLGNVAVNSALSIFLGSIATGVLAGFMATTLIFLLGEIIPQAVISRHALAFGARTAWIVRILLIILFPLCGPIAYVLDKALGREIPTIFSKGELLSVIEEHERSKHSDVDQDEGRILKGALTYSQKKVEDVMTPKTVTFMLDSSEELTPELLTTIREQGHSRIPIFKGSRDNIIGILYVKDLLGVHVVGKKVKDVADSIVNEIEEGQTLDDVLNEFIATQHHMFVVQDEFGSVSGIITIEDVIEEIVGVQIVDEYDIEVDMRKAAKRRMKKRKASQNQ